MLNSSSENPEIRVGGINFFVVDDEIVETLLGVDAKRVVTERCLDKANLEKEETSFTSARSKSNHTARIGRLTNYCKVSRWWRTMMLGMEVRGGGKGPPGAGEVYETNDKHDRHCYDNERPR